MLKGLGRRSLAYSMLLTVLGLTNAPAICAQAVSIASLTGRVVDSSGAFLPDAQIKVIAGATGVIHDTVSNSGGDYSFPSLPNRRLRVRDNRQGLSNIRPAWPCPAG
jgi:Carboxypeptidase regulatory-like domain